MDYDELVAQVIELLQREKRVPYRALKRRFALDDDYIEDLKAELIHAKRLAVDEEGTVLVWTGDAPTGTAYPAQSTQQPTAQPEPLPQGDPLAEPRPPEAERRQLTVMFCDVVDSTALSSQLDPEDYREVIRAYQATCTEVIHRYDGHIAQLLGDGLLVYFGYPQAHEDDAHRAIRTGLEIINAVGVLNTRLKQDKGIPLAVRLGIHTGLVVVGTMGSAGRQEHLALGDVPNVASRLQGLAAPNTVAVSAATYRLVQGYFDCDALGEQPLRGVAEPVAVYRVRGESGAQSRLEVASTRGLTPLVGRESEVTLLLERWHQVKDGHGRVILLSGEGGIGKSRLVQVVKEHVASEPHTRWECRSSPYYQNTALYPLTDFFHRALPWHQDDTPEAKLATLEQTLRQYRLPVAESLPLFAPLLALPLPDDWYPPLALSPQRQRQKTLETIVAILLELTERQPVLFILEDLHWVDPTTLELLGLLMDHTPTVSLSLLLTCRPEFQPPWSHRSYLTEVTVTRLSREQIARMATQIAGGKTFPDEVLHQLADKTDGVPLFVEEITKSLLESGQLTARDGHYELTESFSTFAIPATLHDSLMARLDHLISAKGVAQLGAVMGRQFSYELLEAVSQLDPATLQRELGRLVAAELLYQRGLPPATTYLFKHALIRDAAYEALLKSTRQQYHHRIAQVLEAQFPSTVETQPELLAHHYTEAGLRAQAVGYWYTAGQRAVEHSAHTEALAHLTTGLELLPALPDTPPRRQHELVLQTALGRVLGAIKGYSAPAVGDAYRRAQTLCRQLGDTEQLAAVLQGLFHFHNVRGELQSAYALAEELLPLAQATDDPLRLATAYYNLGSAAYWLGELVAARAYLEHGISCYRPQPHRVPIVYSAQDPGVGCLARAAEVLWLLGFADQAVEHIQAALRLAQTLSHPFTLTWVLAILLEVYQLRCEMPVVQQWAETAMAHTEEHRFHYWQVTVRCIQGWSRAMQGQCEEGIAQIAQGLAAWRVTDAQIWQPYVLALLAEAHEQAGQVEDGLRALTDALVLVEKNRERTYEAEIYRLQGELLLHQTPADAHHAEVCFHQAMAIAQNQSAKSWELRAATSLARLWQQQGKRGEAQALLAPIYGWFTEGFDTADLQEAKALLEELST
jgi:class 3 adenylate cyclase/predicted ATPase